MDILASHQQENKIKGILIIFTVIIFIEIIGLVTPDYKLDLNDDGMDLSVLQLIMIILITIVILRPSQTKLD